MKSKETNVEKLEAQLKQWGVKLNELTTKAGAAGKAAKAEAEADYQKRIADLKLKYEAAQKKLAEFKSAGSGKWADFKDDIGLLWGDLEATFKKLIR
jgi:hypothetical protein